MINFIPYGKQLIDQDDIDAVVEVLNSDYLTTGPKVEKFESAIENYMTKSITIIPARGGTKRIHLKIGKGLRLCIKR